MKIEKLTGRGCEYLFRHPVYKTIYFRRYTTKTGEKFLSLKTKDIAEAKEARDRLLASPEQRIPKKGQRKMANELFDEWFETKRTLRKSPATLTSIQSSRTYLEPYLFLMLPDEVTSEWWVKTYIPEVRAKTHTDRRFFNDRKWLTAFVRWAFENGYVKKMQRFPNPDPKGSPGKVFTDEEVENLINFAQNDDLRLMILMASTMAMRKMEILGLEWDRVDLNRKLIRLRDIDTKTRHPRTFGMSEVVFDELKKRENGTHWVFQSRVNTDKAQHKDGFKTAWANLKRDLNITGRFHDLRHTFLTKAFKAPGANPALICHYAGLSLEVAQKVYLHFTEEDTRSVAQMVRFGN